jgi:hypothetical protein
MLLSQVYLMVPLSRQIKWLVTTVRTPYNIHHQYGAGWARLSPKESKSITTSWRGKSPGAIVFSAPTATNASHYRRVEQESQNDQFLE